MPPRSRQRNTRDSTSPARGEEQETQKVECELQCLEFLVVTRLNVAAVEEFDIADAPGYDKLSEEEKILCSHLHLLPSQFATMKVGRQPPGLSVPVFSLAHAEYFGPREHSTGVCYSR